MNSNNTIKNEINNKNDDSNTNKSGNIKNIVTLLSSVLSSFIVTKFGLSYTLVSLADSIFRDNLLDLIDNFKYYYENSHYYLFNNDNSNLSLNFNNILNIFVILMSLCIFYYILKYVYKNIVLYLVNLITDLYYYNILKIWFETKILKRFNYYCTDVNEMELILNYAFKEKIYYDPSITNNKYIMEENRDNYCIIKSHLENMNTDLEKTLNIKSPKLKKRHYIFDNNFNVSGYIYISFNNRDIKVIDKKKTQTQNGSDEITDSEKVISIKTPYLRIVLNKSVNNYFEYIKKHGTRIVNTYYISNIRQDINGKLVNESKILNSYEIKNTVNYIDYIKSCIKENKEVYIDTFFNENKDKLWNYINTIIFENKKIESFGQIPQITLFPFGPPGCGKSSFAFRIANMIGANIINLKLSNLDKYMVERILDGNFTFHDTINNNTIDMNTYDANINIFVLDEADTDFEQIYYNEMELKMTKLNNSIKMSEIKKLYLKSENNTSLSKEEHEKITTISKEQEDTANIINDNEKITLSELLTIIQGPCTSKQRIIMANTNKFRELFKMNTRLFRCGRFEPVYFGYPTKKIINDITLRYFNMNLRENDLKFTKLNGHETFRLPYSNITNILINLSIFKDNLTNLEKYKLFIKLINESKTKNKNIIEKYKEYEIDYTYYDIDTTFKDIKNLK